MEIKVVKLYKDGEFAEDFLFEIFFSADRTKQTDAKM